jgi:lipopolysaccharide export system protein LptC
MSERSRSLILLVLILIAVGFIFYTRSGYQTNFIDTLR